MPIYSSSDQLYAALRLLFNKIKEDSGAVRSVAASHIAIRLCCTAPSAEVMINGRQNPVKVEYGPAKIRPDLDVTLPADSLHYILMKELPLGKAVASGQMKVKGPVWRSFALEEIFHRGQTLYPQIFKDLSENKTP